MSDTSQIARILVVAACWFVFLSALTGYVPSRIRSWWRARKAKAPQQAPDILTEHLGRWVSITLRSGHHAGGRLLEAEPGRIVVEGVHGNRVIFAASPSDVLVVIELDADDCEAAAAAYQVALADRQGRH
jgi:hypothetical protein